MEHLSIHKDSEVLPKSRGPWSIPSHCVDVEGKLETKDDEGTGYSPMAVILVLGGGRGGRLGMSSKLAWSI